MVGLSLKADVRNRDKLERELAYKLGRQQRSWFRRLLGQLGDVPQYENISTSFWITIGKELAGLIGPFLEEIFLDQARDLMLSQPIGVDWALVNEGAISFVRDYTFELVKGTNRHSQNTLREAIEAYFERDPDVRNIGDLQRSISHLYGPTRAEAIAVTEITRASAEGEYQIAKDLRSQGVDMIAFWQTSEDELVCPICAPLNDRQASGFDVLGKPYWIHPDPKHEGKTFKHPAHPRCRCWPRHELPKIS